ncbi:hypothetical protein AN161_13375 [Lysinibacillus sp. FJAT-14222]|nr:hypothetical protein AN161_13375 [Lysinibacillus sp. FJAT-14222]
MAYVLRNVISPFGNEPFYILSFRHYLFKFVAMPKLMKAIIVFFKMIHVELNYYELVYNKTKNYIGGM